MEKLTVEQLSLLFEVFNNASFVGAVSEDVTAIKNAIIREIDKKKT